MSEIVMENCKFGKTPTGVCLTPACTNKRWSSDTTGYCRDCKIMRGIPVAGVRKPAPVTHINPADVAVDALEEDFIDNVLGLLAPKQLADALMELYRAPHSDGNRLTKAQKMALLRMALTARPAVETISQTD